MRKKNSNFLKNKLFILPGLTFLVLSFGYLAWNKTPKIQITALSGSRIEQKRKVEVFPKQYSDRNITSNAKISDSRFKNITFFDKGNLLSNAISSLNSRGQILTDGSLENGTWLWTPIKYLTPDYIEKIVSGAKNNGINVIYLSIDSFLDIFVMPEGEDKEKAKKDFDDNVKRFISEANKVGIRVDAEAGWQNWAEDGHLYKPGAILDYVISFNKKSEYKFRGFQYDVEVYLLPEYKEDKNLVLSNFLNLVNETVTKLNSTDLHFSVVIPDFYDDNTRETNVIKYKGKNKYTLDHLLSILERRRGSKIIVMSYRNTSQGEDGSIKISEDEVYTANNYSTKVVIAQETGDFPPSYITFFNTSKQKYDKEVSILKKAFENEPSFGGIAVHYINSFLELK